MHNEKGCESAPCPRDAFPYRPKCRTHPEKSVCVCGRLKSVKFMHQDRSRPFTTDECHKIENAPVANFVGDQT